MFKPSNNYNFFDDLQQANYYFANRFRHHSHRMYHHWRWHRGPSRFVWFFLGAGTATLYMKHKEAHAHASGPRRWHHCGNPRIPQEAYSQTSSTNAQQVAPPPTDWQRKKWEYWGWGPQRPVTDAQDAAAPPQTMPGRIPDQLDEERERLRKIAKQATETLSDLSEAGLDSIVSGAASLKARIAERRLRREKELAALQAQRDEKFKQFEEWKRQQEELKEQEAKRPRHLV